MMMGYTKGKGKGKGKGAPPPQTKPPSPNPTPSPTPVPTGNIATRGPTAAPSNAQCIVDVSIMCFSEDFVSCELLTAPKAECQNPNKSVSFSYMKSTTCADSRNQQQVSDGPRICQDFAPLQDLVTVACVDAAAGGRALNVSPRTVSSGNQFSVTDDNLPGTIMCTISDTSGNALQKNTIRLVGSPLHLKEKYGAMQVEACDDQKCRQTATLTYSLENEGENDFTVVTFTRTITNQVVRNLTPMMSPDPIRRNEKVNLKEGIELDLCASSEVVVTAGVEADVEDGPACENSDRYTWVIDPDCQLDVEMECTEDSSDKDCKDLIAIGNPPCDCDGVCSKELDLKYTGEKCGLINVQPGEIPDLRVICVDNTADDVPIPDDVCFTAMSDSGTTVSSGCVSKGDMITLSSSNCLPDVIEIQVIDRDDSTTIYQTVTVQHGCSEGGISLMDPLGAFDFTAYTCEDGDGEDCFTDITFEICTTNESTEPVILVDVELNFAGETFDVLDESVEVEANGRFCVDSDSQPISLCGNPSLEASVTVESEDCRDEIIVRETMAPAPTEAPTRQPTDLPTSRPTEPPTKAPTRRPTEPPTEPPTRQPTEPPTRSPTEPPTEMPSYPQCVARVEISCLTQFGVPCDSIVPPEPMCDGSVQTMSFTYSADSTCNTSLNQQDVVCEDFGPLPATAIITCVDKATQTELRVLPPRASSGGQMTVTNPGSNLPGTVACTLRDESGNIVQTTEIHRTGPLHLKETYGALQVQACDNQVCLQTAAITYTVHNDGSNSMNVVALERDLTGEPRTDLVAGLSSNPIPLDGSATATETIELDICSMTDIEIMVDVDAEPNDGPECHHKDEYRIKIEPVCALDVELTCVEESTNQPCEDLKAIGEPGCGCFDECAAQLSFIYTGRSCESASSDFIVQCTVNNANRPETVLVLAETANGSISVFSGAVSVGDLVTFSLEGIQCPEEVDPLVGDVDAFRIRVTDPSDSTNVFESMILESKCRDKEPGIQLNSSQGPLDFVGYNCPEFSMFCFADVTVTACAMNEGTVPATLTSGSIEMDGTSIVSAGPRSLDSGETFCFEETFPLLLCGEDPEYVFTASAEADDASGEGCRATDNVIVNPPPPEVTNAPTGSIVTPPTGSPTAMPTARITAHPTRSPVRPPPPPPKKKKYYKGKGALFQQNLQEMSMCLFLFL